MPAPTPVNIPIVDFSSCALTKPEVDFQQPDVETTMDEIITGLEGYGCLYLINHGMNIDDLEKLRSTSRQFFNLPHSDKLKCVRTVADPKNGWVAEEMENFYDNRDGGGDLKECFSINLPDIDTFPWPNDDVIPGFRQANRTFMEKLNQLSKRMFKILGIKLCPSDSELFTRAHENFETDSNANPTCLRNLYYPPLTKYDKIGPKQQRLAPHTDFGIFTFLIQDRSGGLEVQDHNTSTWYEAKPLDGAVMIQAADMLERWTSGRIKAPVHRVTIPVSEERRDQARESTVYFVTPNNDVVISCLDGSDKYTPITSGDYLKKRIADIQGSDDDLAKQLSEPLCRDK